MPLKCAIAADQHVLNMLNNNQTNITVLMSMKTESFFKIHYFHVLTSPLKKKIHPDAKTSLKSYVRYQNDMNLSIELSGK
jgi:hypothetical protein